jgi:polyisoprenoid-binding protein YceI
MRARRRAFHRDRRLVDGYFSEEIFMRRMNTLYSIALVLAPLVGLTIGASTASAQAKTFKVDGNGGSSIQFVSDAPLEKFTGKTTSLSGEITVDPAKADKGKGEIKADVATIKTNVALRDEHLAGENWLDAKKYPHAKFVITKISGGTALKPNDLTELKIAGKFTIHGVTKDVNTTAKVRYTPGAKAALRVQSSFTIHLEDYKVSIPKIVSLKVSPDIVVNVDLKATAS